MIKVYLCPFSGTPREIHNKAYSILNELISDKNTVIKKTDKGKPYLDPEEFHFSISHTNDLIVIATSPFNVGIDCERKDRKISMGVGNRFLGGNCDITSWVHFEAFSKLHGEGISVGYEKMLSTPHVFREIEAFEHRICICAYDDFEITIIQ